MYGFSVINIINLSSNFIMDIGSGREYPSNDVEGTIYQFPINCNDESEWKDMYLYPEYKSITLMRWIRKSMVKETLIQLN